MCGEMSAGKPNENHQTFEGNCADGLKCIKNKCRKAGEHFFGQEQEIIKLQKINEIKSKIRTS